MKFCKTVYIHVMLYQNKAFKMTVSGLNNAAMVLSKLTVLSIVSIVIFILQPLQRFVNKTLLLCNNFCPSFARVTKHQNNNSIYEIF